MVLAKWSSRQQLDGIVDGQNKATLGDSKGPKGPPGLTFPNISLEPCAKNGCVKRFKISLPLTYGEDLSTKEGDVWFLKIGR